MTQTGQQHLMSIMQKCETLEKKDQLLRLGGDQIDDVTATTSDAFIFIDVSVISRLVALEKKLPFDTSLLDLPIQIILFLDPFSAWMGGSGVLPTAFTLGTFYVRQLEFKNKAHSLKELMRISPSAEFIQPFDYPQPLNLPFTTSNNPVAPVLSTLVGFRNGNVVGIQFAVLKNSSLLPGGGAAINVFDYEIMGDIILTFNGSVIWRSDGRLADAMSLMMSQTPNYFQNSRLAGAVSPFPSTAINSYIYYIPFAQFDALKNEGDLASGLELGSNSMQLSFTTPNSNGVAATLYVSYIYNAALKVGNSGTTADWIY